MFRLCKIIFIIVSAFAAVSSHSQPACPEAADIRVEPSSPTSLDSIVLRLMLPGVGMTDWVLIEQDGPLIRYQLDIYWQGGPGIPMLWTRLDPMSAGDYEVVISPVMLDTPDACPDITIPLVVSGAPAASVGVPMFSLLGLLLLIGILGGFAWRHLRQA